MSPEVISSYCPLFASNDGRMRSRRTLMVLANEGTMTNDQIMMVAGCLFFFGMPLLGLILGLLLLPPWR